MMQGQTKIKFTFSFLRRPGPDPVSDCRTGSDGWTVQLCWWPPIAPTVTARYVELLRFAKSPDIIPLIKWRRLRWSWHAVGVGRRYTYRISFGYAHEKNHWHDSEVDGGVISKWILKLHYVEMWTGFFWLDRNKWPAVDSTVMNRLVP